MRQLPRPTRRGLLVAGAGASLVVIGSASGFVDVVRAGVFALALVLGAMLLVSAVSALGRGVRVQRRGPDETMQVGRPARILVESSSTAPRSFIDTSLVEPHTFSPHPVRLTFPGRTTYDVNPEHRGRFTSGPSHLETLDPFGLAVHRREVANATEWIVWPRTRPVDELPRSRPGQGEESAVSAFAAQDGEPGASTRAYVRGDDTRLVHWPATARRGELIIRQFDPPTDDVVRLVLVGEGATPGADEQWEALIERCASLWRAVHADRGRADLVIDDLSMTRLDEGLDALALVGTTRPPARTPDVATWAFVHTSCRDVPLAPRHATGHAVVAGDDSAATLVARLEDAGWRASVLHAPAHDHSTTEGAA